MPCNSELYVYLNIEVAIGLIQWKSFATMPSRTSNPLSCDCRRHIGCVQPFCSLSVMGSSSSLMLVFWAV